MESSSARNPPELCAVPNHQPIRNPRCYRSTQRTQCYLDQLTTHVLSMNTKHVLDQVPQLRFEPPILPYRATEVKEGFPTCEQNLAAISLENFIQNGRYIIKLGLDFHESFLEVTSCEIHVLKKRTITCS